MSDDRSPRLSHLGEKGRARMVDVSDKPISRRVALAEGTVTMGRETLAAIRGGKTPKGDVLTIARLAAIGGAKHTAQLIPLCHPLPITSVSVDLREEQRGGERRLVIQTSVGVTDRTGVEMEALVAASVAALAVYDMCKAVDRGMSIKHVRLLRKEGGRSGLWVADSPAGGGSA